MFDFLAKRFGSLFGMLSKESELTETNIQSVIKQIKDTLMTADVPFAVVNTFTDHVQKDLVGKKVPKNVRTDEYVLKIVYQRMVEFLGQEAIGGFTFQIPSVVMVMGLQGSGKTTTVAKLAHFIKMQAEKKHKTRSILVGSVDFYRPAAIDQLEIMAGMAAVDFYRPQATTPLAAAIELYEKFKKERYELLFLDTAGRLHIDQQMLDELAAIEKALMPKYKFLVLDGMTGQQSLSVAQSFDAAVGFYAAIVTKMDSEAPGGSVFAFRYVLKKPIWFVGTGEKVEDLQPFYPDRIAQHMLSMGDLQTLMEQVNDKIKKSDQEKMNNSLFSDTLTLEDFSQQIDMVSRLGSLSHIMKYIPGVAHTLSADQLQTGDREMKKFKAIINSMNKKERVRPALIDASRTERIARGAGVHAKDVTILLERFEQVKQYAKLLKKSGPFKGLFR